MSASRAVVIVAIFASGCATASRTPPAEPYRLSRPEVTCPHPVELLTLAQASRPAYRELARLSATCPKLSPTTCEQFLLARGCEVGADAIVVQRELPIARVKHPPQMAAEAIAVRFATR